MKFCEKLTICRKTSKQYNTQEKLAKATEISKSDISKFERGEARPSSVQAELLGKVLGDSNLSLMLEEEIEFERTHPIVKICFSDKTFCWKCGRIMKSVYGLVNGYPLSPDDFDDSMIAISKAKGVVLEERKSATTGETHLANICPHCGAFIGEFYLHDLWYGETETIIVEDVSKFIIPKEQYRR